MEQEQPKVISSQTTRGLGLEPIRGTGTLFLGIDIGSTSSDVVVLDNENRIVLSDYRRTKGKPVETFRTQLREIFAKINPANVRDNRGDRLRRTITRQITGNSLRKRSGCAGRRDIVSVSGYTKRDRH